jgi:hypothetical protein
MTIMEWVLTLTSGVVVLCLLGPLVILLGGLMLFGLLGHVVRSGPAVWRTTFDCPFSKQRASVEFLGEPASDPDHPGDVLSCSVFAPKAYHVRCQKACLGLAETRWALSPMMPRYALLSGDVAYRVTAGNGHQTVPETSETSQTKTAS